MSAPVVERRRFDVQGLPPGWKREEIIRKSGLSAGKTDVYYYREGSQDKQPAKSLDPKQSPEDVKIRSKPELARALGPNFDLSAFDFRSGKVLQSAIRKSKRMRGPPYDFARGIRHDANLVLPIRQTASIFKQPVTVIRTRPESKTRTDLKHGPQEQPRQLFWERRLKGLNACDVNEQIFKTLDLPKTIQPAGPELSTENLLQSIAAALHLNNQPLTGQVASRASISKNPGVHINTDQPLIQSLSVNEDDIKRQEGKVLEARKQLQQAMAAACT